MNPKPSFLEGFKQKLKIRKEPKTQKEFFRHIKDEVDEEPGEKRELKKPREIEEQEPEKPVEKEPEEEEPKRPQLKRVQIIDKSATSAIDRDLILKRIKEAKMSRLPGAVPPPPMEPILEEPEEPEDKVEEKEREPEMEAAPKPPQKIKIRVSKKRVTIKAPEPGEPVPPPPTKEVVAEPTEKRKRGRPKLKIVSKVPIKEVLIDNAAITARLPQHEKVVQRVSSYYMNNRKIAVEKLRRLFEPERREFQEKKETVSCDSAGGPSFDLLPHQKIAREYLNLYTPYRGLLLYFSLGSGKSCTSIAITEGMKTDKRVFIMTPASLKMNFFTELKKCGDPLFKKNQYWEFVSISGHPEYIEILSKALSLPRDTIENKGGAWLVDIQKPANFSELNGSQQKEIDDQLNEMIRAKYTDLNYNGMNMRKMRELTDDFTKNPFDHSVVVIDEAHNFVSRIVNKIKKKNSISYMLYDLLMKATDVRIVLLSGTPIINYPNEIGIMYNILRGYIKTWVFRLNMRTDQRLNKAAILHAFENTTIKGKPFRTYDYVDFSGDKLIVTRNPYGFINTKKPGPGRRGATTKVGGAGKTKRNKATNKRTTKKRSVEPPIVIDLEAQDLLESDDDLLPSEQEFSRELMDEIDQSSQGNRVAGLDYDKLPLVQGGDEGEYDPSKYNGVRLDETGNISDEDFEKMVIAVLKSNKIDVIEGATEIIMNKALPDDSDSFMNLFIDQDQAALKNKSLLQRRILGLTSYYRSAQEQLLPSLVETIPEDPKEAPSVIHVEETDMSDYQFKIYSEIRKEEREQERRSKVQAKRKRPAAEEDIYKVSSTYRIFSRAACNFVFPTPPGRPMPTRQVDEVINEAKFDATPARLLQATDEYADNEDAEEEEKTESADADSPGSPTDYAGKIEAALKFLKEHADEYLTERGLATYSPKFRRVLENLKDDTNRGLHLIYSQFRTIEGIGILQLILEANGFERLIVRKNDTSGEWSIDTPLDSKKPRFLLYTGTETPEEREIMRNIYNSQWEFLPSAMADELRKVAENNHMGEIVKIIMITASGAEGINLRNTRFVHIVEPYWHMVRLEQVIGRARRICSHQDLPEELRTVKVFLYMSSFTEEQSTSDTNKELIINDVSKLDKKTPLTTDQSLYESARIKDTINQQILTSIKESAVDCGIYGSSKENLVCYGFGKITSNDFGSFPSLAEDEANKDDLNIKKEAIKLRKATINGIEYAYHAQTGMVYDLESYMRSKKTGENLIVVGKVVKKGRNVVIEPVLA